MKMVLKILDGSGITPDKQITIQNGLKQCTPYKFEVGANPNGPFSEPIDARTSRSGK